MSREGEEQVIKRKRRRIEEDKGCDKRLKRKEEMRGGSGGKRQKARSEAERHTEGKDEEFRMKRGGGVEREGTGQPG